MNKQNLLQVSVSFTVVDPYQWYAMFIYLMKEVCSGDS